MEPSVAAVRWPVPSSSAAITPIVFWASLAPCPNDTAPADTSWSHLKGLALSGTWKTFCTKPIRYIAMNAITNATSGLAMMAMAVFSTLPQLMASVPPAASPAPTRPPISAWLEEDGIPTHQVA